MAVVVIGGGTAGVILASSDSGHKPTPVTTTLVTTNPTSVSTTVSPDTTVTTTTPPPASLAANVPFDNCIDIPVANRGIPGATDEVGCTGSDVGSEGAVGIFYATFPSASSAASYVAGRSSGAGAPNAPCNIVQLGVGSAYCDFTDSSSLSGTAVLFIGQEFTFGPDSNSQNTCAQLGASSGSGTSVLVWNYASTNVIGGAMSCSASTNALSSMRTGLYNGDLELDSQ